MNDQDIQWTRIVELELVPHPDQPRPEITEMDYGMRGGVLHMKLRAATAGYIFANGVWTAPPTTICRGPEYRLWLRNHLANLWCAQRGAGAGLSLPDQQRLEAETD